MRLRRTLIISAGERPIDLPEEPLRAVEETLAHGRVFFATEGRELFQLETLFAIQVGRNFDDEPGDEITAAATIHVHNSFVTQLEQLSILRSGRNFDICFSFESRHRNFAPK